MKNILYLTLVAILLSFASCQEIDNWDEPDARLYGNVIDEYTGQNLVMDNNDWQIRIFDRTWEQNNPGTVAQYQSLAVIERWRCITIQNCFQEFTICFLMMDLFGLLIRLRE